MSLKQNIEDIFPLTPLQKGLLFHSLYAPESAVYFEQLSCRLEGQLLPEIVEQGWQVLLDRHAILRTAIATKGQKEPVQVVFRQLPFQVRREDWRGWSEVAKAEQLEEFLHRDRRQGFAIDRPPLMRVTLIRLAAQVWQLVWSHHHLLLDGWSWPLLLQEFFQIYRTLSAGEEVSLPPVRSYKDYISWLTRQDASRAEGFWRDYLRGFDRPTALELLPPKQDSVPGTVDLRLRRRPAWKLLPGGTRRCIPHSAHRHCQSHLSPEETLLVSQLARECGTTLNTVVQGAWGILLGRYARSEDVVYGIVVASRPPEIPGIERTIGPLINTLPLRLLLDPESPLHLWLQQLQQQQARVREFDSSSLVDIQGWSEVPRGQPLFETLLAFENFPDDRSLQPEAMGLRGAQISFFESTHYPLTLVVIPAEQLVLKLSYRRDCLSGEAAELLLAQLRHLLLDMAARPQVPLKSLSLLGEHPPKRSPQVPCEETLPLALAAAVSRWGDRVALSCGEQQWTYQQLDEDAIALGHYLQSRGVKNEVRVAICLDRGYQLLVAMLATVKGGGVYVPLDPAYPQERLAYTIADCEAALVLTTRELCSRLPHSEAVVCLDELELPVSGEPLKVPTELNSQSGAYIIYTSGSTGKPKGVLVSQSNVIRLFRSTECWFGFNETDVWTFFHSFAFDFSVWEIWGAILYGGRLVIVPYTLSRDPERFLELLRRERVTVLNQTPSAFAGILAAQEANPSPMLTSLRWIIFGGEALNLPSLRPWFDRYGETGTRLVNMYGITETTVHVTYRAIARRDVEAATGSLIGQPISDLQIYLFDSYGNLLPRGVIGEIYVGGAGVSLGYLNRADLNRDRFPNDPFSLDPKARLYRTGDLGRFLPDGDLEYLGRLDNQVKIRGFRLEIGEIEAALVSCEGVRESLVLARSFDGGEKRLVAYLVCSSDAKASSTQLRSRLQSSLPDYMIPARFVFLERFPLTPNGKIDRAALPEPTGDREDLGIDFEPPQTPEEEILARIWQQVLGIDRVGRGDNYFALGGDSIRSIRVCSLAREAGLNLTLEQLFNHPVLGELAANARSQGEIQARAEQLSEPFSLLSASDRLRLQEFAEDAYPLVRLQAGMLFHSRYTEAATAYNDLFSFRLRLRFDLEVWERAYREILARHRSLRTAFFVGEYSQPLQVVFSEVAATVEFRDLSGLSSPEQEAELEEFFQQERSRPFDWSQAPLMRFYLHQLDRDGLLQGSLVIHHAILDGWSFAQLVAELMQHYLHLLGCEVPALSAPPQLSYAKFIALEQEALTDEQQRAFWQAQLKEIPFTSLPRWPEVTGEIEFPEAAIVANGNLGKLDLTLATPVARGLKDIAAASGVPLKTVLLAIHLWVIASQAGETEVVTGLVGHGRPEERDGDRVLGLFLNTIPLRVRLPIEGGTWTDLIRETFKAQSKVFPYRRFPLAEIQRLCDNRSLYETSFNFVNFHIYQGIARLRDVELLAGRSFDETNIPLSVSWNEEAFSGAECTPAFPLESNSSGVGGRVSLNLSYDVRQFPTAQIVAIAKSFQQVCQVVANHPEISLEAIAARTQNLPQRAIATDSIAAFPSVLVRFEQQVEMTPDASAIAFGEEVWSYRELNEKANGVARILQELGVKSEVAVGLYLERSLDLVCAMLAVWKAGGCYVPLDPDYPRSRLQLMLEIAKPALVLTHSRVNLDEEIWQQADCQVIELDCLRAAALASQSVRNAPPHAAWKLLPGESAVENLELDGLAYLIFTSGSTGRPKGIGISHRALANHMHWFLSEFQVSNEDVVLQKTPFSFDASVWEFWATLMVGGKLVLAAPGGHRDSAYLVRTVRDAGVSLLQVVPSLLEVLLLEPELQQCRCLRTVFSGGEALKGRIWQTFSAVFEGVELVNLYGPTETTIDVAFHRCKEREIAPTIEIGTPVWGTQLYILDRALNRVEIGTPGELYIGGVQLARGYCNAPALSAASFIPDPFAQIPGSRLYRTGDRARYLPDGNIEFLGRLDRQVKVRGFRIEVGEVVAALERFALVMRAVVKSVVMAEQPRLVAYVQLQGHRNDWQQALHQHLRAIVPEHAIPTVWVAMTEWPLLPNGKVDLNALPVPSEQDYLVQTVYVPPRNATEAALVEIWREVLQVARIGIEDDFFQLGGDSILCLRIIAKARESGLYFTPKDLFDAAHIAALATRVRQSSFTEEAIATPGTAIALTPIQRWFFRQSLPRPQHWNQALWLDLKGEFTPDRVRQAIAMVGDRDVFRLRFRFDAGEWRQELSQDDREIAFDRVDLSAVAVEDLSQHLTRIASEYQRQLDLEQGPLLRAVYCQTPDRQPDKLLLIVHHLVIDGVSWRVLLEDLAIALAGGERPASSTTTWCACELELDSSSVASAFLQWAQFLPTLAQSDRLMETVAFWQQQSQLSAWGIPLDFNAGLEANLESSAAQVECRLTPEITAALLYELPRTHRVRIQEVLLSALLEAVTARTGETAMAIALESHGRDSDLWEFDLSRAVGWFTALFPLQLQKIGSEAIENLHGVKAQLRRVSQQGIGYGLLGDSDILANIPLPDGILFNYLGQFDSSLPESAPFALAQTDVGESRDPEGRRPFQLEIVALIVEHCLQVRFVFSSALHRQATMETLAKDFEAAIIYLVETSRARDVPWLPTDFPLAQLDRRQLQTALAGSSAIEDLYPLSPVQEGILFHARHDRENGVYLQQAIGIIEGNLDPERFRRAWENCISRHSSLRASFVLEDLPRPLQRIHSQVELPFICDDWRDCNPQEISQRWQKLVESDRLCRFTLEQAPLMRLTLVQLEDERWQFLWTHHHLLLDGWSLPIVFGDVLAGYAGKGNEVPTPANYREFIAWLASQDSQEADATELESNSSSHAHQVAATFWQQTMGGVREATRLGLSNTCATTATLEYTLSPQIYRRLQTLARRYRVTLNAIASGAWSILYSLYSGGDEVVYGVTVAGRPPELAGIENTVGVFINTLPLRVEVDPAAPLEQWFQRLRDTFASINQFSFSRLVDIQGWSEIARGQPLFESIFIYENYPVAATLTAHQGTIVVRSLQMLEQNHYPVSVYILPGESLTIKLAFAPGMGSDCERQQLLDNFVGILEQLAIEEPHFLGEIALPNPHRVLDNPQTFEFGVWDVPQLCRHRAAIAPEKLAVRDEADRYLTYGELDAYADRLARMLQSAGIGIEMKVALCLERHVGLAVGLLGILKAGAAVVPLDPAFGCDRLAWMVPDSQAAAIVTQQDLRSRVDSWLQPDTAVFVLDEEGNLLTTEAHLQGSEAHLQGAEPHLRGAEPHLRGAEPHLRGSQAQTENGEPTTSERSAYLIYTSGSTGKPKGVEVSHSALVNFLLSFARHPGLTPEDSFVAVTTLSFDISLLEILLPLITGAHLTIADRETARDGFQLAQLLQNSGASAMQATPTTWRLLTAADWRPATPFRALCGGEAMPQDLARDLLDRGVELSNVYGPTETTIWSALGAVRQPLEARAIATAIANTSLYILDRAGHRVPEGTVGELFIGGTGVARGYHHRPSLTAEKFIPNPYAKVPGERLYRTGDLARWLPGDQIEILGRSDFQVKIRGFRIELGEVEAALCAHPAITSGVVGVVGESSDRRLAAYIVLVNESERPTPETLRQDLAAKLPDYMLPSHWIYLDALPLTANNKIDRRALPLPSEIADATELESNSSSHAHQVDAATPTYIAPRNDLETALTLIWQDVLSVEKIGIGDNFFDLGGHSLTATRLHAYIRKIFAIELSLRDLFAAQTIAAIAQWMSDRDPQPQRTQKIARAFIRLQQMTPEEKAKLMQAKNKTF